MIVDAVLERLESDYPVYEGVVVDADGNPFPGSYYVVYGGHAATVGDGRLAKGQDAESDRWMEFTIRSVSPTPAGARILSNIAFGRLVGWTPDIDGRTFGSVQHDGADAPRIDDKVRPAVWFADDDYVVENSR